MQVFKWRALLSYTLKSIALVLPNLAFDLKGEVQEGATLVDRLVFQIEARTYSQRHFELYMAVKGAGYESTDYPLEVVNDQNYAAKLEEYTVDMMIDYEADRLNAFSTEAKEFKDSLSQIEAKFKTLGPLKGLMNRLRPNEDTLSSLWQSARRVQNLIRLRARQGQWQEEADRGLIPPKDIKDSEWFLKIKQQLIYRLYEDARTYKLIVTPWLNKS